jgi:hypothetical protein
MEKILWAADNIREVHPQIPPATAKKLKALILLMRYSGIRISDAVMFRRGSLKDGKLFLRQEKTKHPVLVSLPPFFINAVMDCDEGDEYFFYRPVRDAENGDHGLGMVTLEGLRRGRAKDGHFAPTP